MDCPPHRANFSSNLQPYLKAAVGYNMKRNRDFSSSDSELDDNTEADRDSADENGHFCSPSSSLSPSASQAQARKRRRGIIEKRRRDRINNCLSELRRLVPNALEKQGSAKLEKAEILQMTVDHLKMMHATGSKSYFEAQSVALDYHALGFRECLAETSRYLSVVEGLDNTDLLRIRLLSHLSCCISQREAHSTLGHFAWSPVFGPRPIAFTRNLLQQWQFQAQTEAHSISSGSDASPSSSSLPSSSSQGSATAVDSTASSIAAGGICLAQTAHVVPLSLPLLPSLSALPISIRAFPLLSPAASSSLTPAPTRKRSCRAWGTEVGAF